MTASAEKIESLQKLLSSVELRCTCCKQWLKNPQLLGCLDSICSTCLATTEGECPLCKAEINDKLRNNPFVSSLVKLAKLRESHADINCDYCGFEKTTVKATVRCLDCGDNLCIECNLAHCKTKLTRNHTTLAFQAMSSGKYDSLIREREIQSCSQHIDQSVIKYCSTCDQLLCRDCLDVNSGHEKHQVGLIAEIGLQAKTSLSNANDQLKTKLQKMDEYKNFITDYQNNLTEQKESLTKSIEEQAEILHALVEAHKTSLLGQLEEIVSKEMTDLSTKEETLKDIKENIIKSLDFSDSLIAYGRGDEILSVQKIVKERLNYLSNMQMQAISGQVMLTFVPGSTPERSISLVYGKMTVSNKPSMACSSVNGSAPEPSYEPPSPPSQFYSKNSYNFNKSNQSLNGSSHTNTNLSLLNRVELVLEFDAKSPLDTRDIWPTGVAVTDNREFYVLDRDNKCVKIFSPDGRYKSEFGNPGSGEGSLANPYDMAVVENSLVLVTDYQHEIVKCYTMHGHFKASYKGPFKHPRGITAVSYRRFAVVDCRTRHLTLHEADTGLLLKTFKEHILVDPYYVCFTGDERLVITDWASPNLKLMDMDGRLLSNTGSYGNGAEQLLQPYGVVSDRIGHILVADNSNHRVHLVSKDGKFQKFLISKFDNLWHPMALTLSTEGHLVVTEALGKIKVFRYCTQ